MNKFSDEEIERIIQTVKENCEVVDAPVSYSYADGAQGIAIEVTDMEQCKRDVRKIVEKVKP